MPLKNGSGWIVVPPTREIFSPIMAAGAVAFPMRFIESLVSMLFLRRHCTQHGALAVTIFGELIANRLGRKGVLILYVF